MIRREVPICNLVLSPVASEPRIIRVYVVGDSTAAHCQASWGIHSGSPSKVSS